MPSSFSLKYLAAYSHILQQVETDSGGWRQCGIFSLKTTGVDGAMQNTFFLFEMKQLT
jgi:hypothetical protein